MEENFNKVWAVARLAVGFVFFWAFIDKLFGLGFSTCYDDKAHQFLGVLCKSAWLSGGSPTFGFLKFATKGPLAGLFQALATSHAVEWLFMLGLLGIGAALMLGVVNKLASVAGIAMLSFMYLSMLWPATNPFLDEHIIYIIILLAFIFKNPGKTWGLGDWWANTALVKKRPCLE